MGKTQQDVIKMFMQSLDNTKYSGTKALNQAVKYATGGYFSDITTAINQLLADCKKLGANKFLLEKCGINLSNTDTGAIVGADAGGKKVKTPTSIVPESGKLDTTFKDNSFQTNGLTFRLYRSVSSSNQTYIWRALKTWWAKESLDLIENSYGYSFNDADATVKEIFVVFKNEPKKSYLAYVDYPQKINGRYALTLNINEAHFKNLKSSNVDGKSSKYPVYLDRIIAHELTHAVMMAKVDNYEKLPTFITEGLGDLTQGIDDMRPGVISDLAKNYKTLQTYLNLKATANTPAIYAAGYIFLRYLAKQGAANYGVIPADPVLTVEKNFAGNEINISSSAVETVDASALTKAVKIYGNSSANSILAGAGNDTLSGGAGNDSLTGGKGNDVFIYTGGNDIITDYTADDKISFDVAVSKTTTSGSDILFKTSKGTLRVKGGKGKSFNITDSKGKEHALALGSTTLTLTNAATSPVTVDSAIKVINAAKRTTAIEITGNANANTITGGSKNDTLSGNAGNDKIYGGNGNDSLWGGKGNDSLWGDAGADKFFYAKGDGKDIIFGFDDNDTLTFDNLAFKAAYDKKTKAVSFTVSGGSVTLKNFTATTFHVNSDAYKISGSKLVKK